MGCSLAVCGGDLLGRTAFLQTAGARLTRQLKIQNSRHGPKPEQGATRPQQPAQTRCKGLAPGLGAPPPACRPSRCGGTASPRPRPRQPPGRSAAPAVAGRPPCPAAAAAAAGRRKRGRQRPLRSPPRRPSPRERGPRRPACRPTLPGPRAPQRRRCCFGRGHTGARAASRPVRRLRGAARFARRRNGGRGACMPGPCTVRMGGQQLGLRLIRSTDRLTSRCTSSHPPPSLTRASSSRMQM